MQLSSSDEEIANTPGAVSKKRSKTFNNNKKSNKRSILDSDEEEEVPKTTKKPKTPEPKKDLKLVDQKVIFGNKPVVRIPRKVPTPKKTLTEEEIAIHSDEELEKTLLSLDTSVLMDDFNEKIKKKTPVKKTPQKVKEERNRTPAKEETIKIKTPVKIEIKEEVKKSRTPSGSAKKPKPKKDDLAESSQTDEERHEKKILTAILFQKYKNRGGAINPGSKEIPKGKPNCLSHLSFLVTGLMESIERDECTELIKSLGGKIISGVTKKLDYLVIGEEAGPAKLAKADELGTKILSEDDLFNLIRKKSGIIVDKKRRKSSDGCIDEDVQPKLKKERRESPKKEENLNGSKIKKERKETPKKGEDNSDGYVTVVVKKKEAISPKKEVKENFVQQNGPVVDNCMLAWVEKYKPTTIKSIIGQQGAASNCEK